MPRRTRKYLVGKQENHHIREREYELQLLARELRREWRWRLQFTWSRDAA